MKVKRNSFDFENRFFAFYLAAISFVQTSVSLVLGGEKCLCCSKRTLRIPLCKSCLPKIFVTGFERACSHCGRALVSEIGICMHCRENQPLQNVDGAFSLHTYQLWKKTLLFAWKMEGRRNLSVYFAAIFYQKLKALEEKFGQKLCVVPVPPRTGKLREKGWDQIEELCFYLEKGWNVNILRLLERLSRVQQKKLDRVQRIEGISSSYRLKSKKKLRRIAKTLPEILVLADDVMTTGSTIEACARELKKIGVKQVYSITLFSVD